MKFNKKMTKSSPFNKKLKNKKYVKGQASNK